MSLLHKDIQRLLQADENHRSITSSKNKIKCKWLKHIHRNEEGQALVESALVIPLMTFMILGIVQLAMVQHARIMTEYAAFNAARAGIVWNADPFIMENAAIISLLPANDGLIKEADIGNPTQMLKRILQRALLYQMNRRLPQAVEMIRGAADDIISQIPIGGKKGQEILSDGADKLIDAGAKAAEAALTSAIGKALGSDEDRLVRVELLSPSSADMTALGGNQEIDFDEFNKRDANRLTIRVRFMYMMRIPFANWIIHNAWMAGRAGQKLYGAVWNAQTQENETGFRDVADYKGPSSGDYAERDLQVAAELSKNGVYMIPLTASYTMRMQSNPYRISTQLK